MVQQQQQQQLIQQQQQQLHQAQGLHHQSPIGLPHQQHQLQQTPSNHQQSRFNDSFRATMTTSTPASHVQASQHSTASEVSKITADQSETKKEPPVKLVKGFLAVCQTCGYTGIDHAKCQRCKRIFTDAPRRVPEPDKPMSSPHPPPLVPTGVTSTPLHTKVVLTGDKSGPGSVERDAIAGVKGIPLQKKPSQTSLGSMLSIRGLARGGPSARGARGRGRSTSSKYQDAEPVIFTLSSDDEDHEPNDKSKSGNKPSTVPIGVQKVPFPAETDLALR